MKKHIYFLFAAILFSSCQSLINDIDYLFMEKVTLKGKISTLQSVNNAARVKSDELSLANAEKVMIFYGNEYILVDIKKDGTFAGHVPIGNSTVVTFLTSDNEFIGNLYTGGLNFLPLNGLEDDVDVIDFSTLTLENKRVIPANDPIGKTIKLSDAELDFMQEIGKFYESMAKNIDMDNDGVPDLYKNISIFLSTNRGFEAGTFGVKNEKEAQITKVYEYSGCDNLKIEGYVDWFSQQILGITNHATLSGPAHNPYNDIVNTSSNKGPDNEKDKESYYIDFGRQNNRLFESGIYTLHMDKRDFTFDYYFDLNMKDFWVYAMPTLVTDKNGYVTEVSIDYTMKDGRKLNPEKIISSSISLNLSVYKYENAMDVYDSWGMNGQPLPGEEAIVEIVRRDLLTSLKKNYNFYKIELREPIKLSNIKSVQTSYIDLFGNSAGNGWNP